MKHESITEQIIGAFYAVYNVLGWGFLEKVYQGAMEIELQKRGLAIMDAHNGEVWAKLDAGTEEYFKLINRTHIPFARILKNIAECAKDRPVVIQSLFLKVRGVAPSDAEIGEYCRRLKEIDNISPARSGIKLVQVYTLARKAMTVVEVRR